MNALTLHGPYSTVITVESDGQIAFTVGDSLAWKQRSKTEILSITRWLLTTWKKEVIPLGDYFYCFPYGEDEIKGTAGLEYREIIYERLGFEVIDDGMMGYGDPLALWANT